MSQTYMKRQKKAAAGETQAGQAPEREAPALAGLQGSGFEGAVDAIQNVDPHAGRKLSLDGAMAGRMERQFGIRMDQVELRESPQAAQMDARAFAKGNVVQFAPGQFQPDTEQGQQLIQHELGHVVQQARGNVRADMPGMNLNVNEGLEHQADLGNLSAGGGAPMSLSSLNAETAPVQGNFFSKIKGFFKMGKGLKKRDETAQQMTAEHETEQAEIADVMRAQGYSDEEIQAQLMFQRVNMSGRRAAPVKQAALDAYSESYDVTTDAVDGTISRMGHGTLTKGGRERQQQIMDHFNQDVLAGGEQEAQAEQMAADLGARRAAQGGPAQQQERKAKPNDLQSLLEALGGNTKTAAPTGGGSAPSLRELLYGAQEKAPSGDAPAKSDPAGGLRALLGSAPAAPESAEPEQAQRETAPEKLSLKEKIKRYGG